MATHKKSPKNQSDSIILDTEIWANTPPDALHDIQKPSDSKIAKGWVFGEKPPYYFENWLMNKITSGLHEIQATGIPRWNKAIEYEHGALVYHNGYYYESLVTSNEGNTPPVHSPQGAISSFWKEIIFLDHTRISNGSTNPGTAANAHKFAQLGADGKILASQLGIGTMIYTGSFDVTKQMPDLLDGPAWGKHPSEKLEKGDYITATDPHNPPLPGAPKKVHTSWTGIAGTDAHLGESYVFDGTKWNDMGGLDESRFKNLINAEGTVAMKNDLILKDTAVPGSPRAAVPLGYVDSRDNIIISMINTEIAERKAADILLGKRIDTEATTRYDADIALGKRIDDLKSGPGGADEKVNRSGDTMTGKLKGVKATDDKDFTTAESYAKGNLGGTIKMSLKVENGLNVLYISNDGSNV